MSGWRLLRAQSSFRSLWSARAISFFGDMLTRTALLLHVEEVRGTGTAVGVLLLAFALPRLLGPIAGTLADRMDQRRLMMATDLGQMVVVGSVAWFLPSFPVLVGLVAVSATLSTLFLPAGRAAIPELVADDEIGMANALVGTGVNIGLALGPGVAGVLFGSIGVRGTLVADVVTFALSLALLRRLPSLTPDSTEPVTGFWVDVREGLAAIGSNPVARATTVGLLLLVSFLALDNVASLFLARDVLQSGPEGFGFLEGAWGAGMLAGSLATVSATARIRSGSLLVLGAIISGMAVLAASVSPTIGLAVAAFAIGGLGNGFENVATDTLIQSHVPRRVRGRVFGVAYSGALAGDSLASFIGGPLLDATSARAVLAISGAGALGVAAIVRAIMPPFARGRFRQ